MYQNESAPWLLFRAWNTDGTPKTDLVYNTTGIVLYQARNNEDKTTITLSNASSATDWAAGKFWQISGNLYRVGTSTASISSYTGFITVQGAYTGGTLEGIAVKVEVVPSTHTAANVLTALGTGTWATAIPWNAAWDVEVQSEVNDALVALDLDSALIAQGAERAVNVDNSHRVHSHVYDMQANTITASALAADAVAEIQSGLATSAALQVVDDNVDQIAIDTTTLLSRVTSTVATLWANLTAMITGSGATAKFTTTALENAPAGGGGGSVVISTADIAAIAASVTRITPQIKSVASNTYSMIIADTWVQQFATADTTEFVLSIKTNVYDDDDEAVLLLSSLDGLTRLNGAAYATTSHGTITHASSVATATVDSEVTKLILSGDYVLTLKALSSATDVSVVNGAAITISVGGVQEVT